jgi:ABC-type transport system involved in multi-copper enzyme maturation permease subunit
MTTEAASLSLSTRQRGAARRMLVHKAWLETRVRFLASATILALLGLSTVLRARPTIAGWESFHSGEQMPYALYVWLSLSRGYLMFYWIICAVLLGLGGLVREQSLGTAGFTLSLPVSRSAYVTSRALVGAAEAFVLALIPGVIVALLSPVAGYRYALSQALGFGVLMACGGMGFYALAFLLSHIVRGEYATPGIALGLTAGIYVLVKLPELAVFDVFKLMTGAEYMVEGQYVLGDTFPVLALLCSLGVAALFVVGSERMARRREF